MENLNYSALAARLEMFAKETFGEGTRFISAGSCGWLKKCQVEVKTPEGRRVLLTLEDITEEDNEKTCIFRLSDRS